MAAQTKEKHKYELEAVSHSPFCSDQNLFLCIASYNGDTGRPSSVVYGSARPQQQGIATAIGTGDAAESISVSIYTVPVEYPESRDIADSPPYELEYKVLRDGKVIDKKVLTADRWGGLQIVGEFYK